MLKEKTFKCVVDGKEKNYKIVRPTFAIGNMADLMKKKAFNDALKAGIPTTFQLREELDANDFFTKTSSEIEDLERRIVEKIEELGGIEDLRKGEIVAIDIRRLRALKMLESFKVNNLFENTCEIYSDNIKYQYYASQITIDVETNKKVWASFDEFQNSMGDDMASKAIDAVILLNLEIKDSFELDLPENQWLLKHNLITADGEYIGVKEEVEETKTETPKDEVVEEKVVEEKVVDETS